MCLAFRKVEVRMQELIDSLERCARYLHFRWRGDRQPAADLRLKPLAP